MSLWFEIVIVSCIPFFILLMLNLGNILNKILDYEEAQYKQQRTLTKWLVTSGMVELVKEIFGVGKKIKDMRKNDKKN